MKQNIYKGRLIKETENFKIYADRYVHGDGSEDVRLFLEDADGWKKILCTPLSALCNNIPKVTNFGHMIEATERMKLIQAIQDGYIKLPIIKEVRNPGWQISMDGEVTGFIGSRALNTKGEYIDDHCAYEGLGYAGELNVDIINQYMHKTIEREAILLYALSAPIRGLYKGCNLLSIRGLSSKGKTKLSEFCISLFGQHNNSRLYHTFNVTTNCIETDLSGIKGMAMLVDDTSINDTKRFNYEGLVYRLANGAVKGRLKKDGTRAVWPDFSGNIIFTTEESLLSKTNPNHEGVVGRLIEIPAYDGILFDSGIECDQIYNYSSRNYGLVAPLLVEKILSIGLDEIKNRVEQVASSINKKMGNDCTILNRYAQLFAIMGVTADLCRSMGLKFHTGNILRYLADVISEMLEDIRDMQDGDFILTEIYPKLMEKAICFKDGRYFIKGGDFKEVVEPYFHKSSKGIKINSLSIKDCLIENKLMERVRGNRSEPHTIKGESKRGYILLERGDRNA
ncbi:DUF927 domain-containing protein [Lachnoclostridium pacaense]|uniref:DUF927 domain-containing protein n=1 Tax=Enterocloster hominis (ex Hitch et al. 2024) TaxID=1917870 RepID=UPI001D0F74CB|nr:DUF927 domain-containing protein [Lachnoclostridium pacaense]MCC2818862.1 DUF927 domain-containing protein [Lachnoclostridium pacaense]